MPRNKETRNPQGSIFKKVITKHGRKLTVYDARKRFFDPASGKYKDKTRRCYTHAEAVNALNALNAEAVEEITNEERLQKDATLYELIEYFEREYVKPAVYIGKRKVSGYRVNLEQVRYTLKSIKTFFGNIHIRKINYEQCRSYAEHLATTKNKYDKLPTASTINKKLSIFRRVLTVAVQKEWIASNPFTKGQSLIQKNAENRRTRLLGFDEEMRLLRECVDETRKKTVKHRGREIETEVTVRRSYLRPFILLALDTAMRRGEIYDLKWWQIDFKNRVIYLTEEAAVNSKTGEEGVLPMTTRLYEILGEVKAATPRGESKDLVLGRIDFKKAFANACADAGIENLQFRDLRATGATRMLLSGTNDAMTRKVTRHTISDTLLKHYTRVDLLNAQSIGARLDDFIADESAKAETDEALKVKAKVNKNTVAKRTSPNLL